jgi:hypothetical protein
MMGTTTHHLHLIAIEIDFIGFLPDTNLGECLRDEIFEAIREQIQEEL